MITRSLRSTKITSRSRQKEYYSDFAMNFGLNPITGSLTRLINEESVKQSIKNIVMTQQGERFYSMLGSTLPRSLFDPMDTIMLGSIHSSINEAIKNYEPRAINVQINIRVSQDQSTYIVDISFGLINIPTIVHTVSIVNRIR